MVDEDDFDPLNDDAQDIAEPGKEPPELQRRAEQIAELRKAVEARQGAYRRIFNAGLGDDFKLVIEDLRVFCRGETTTYDENPRTHALLTGRQEVYNRIKDHTHLDLDTLFARYHGA